MKIQMKSMTLLSVMHGSCNTTWYSQCIPQVKLTWVTIHSPCHTPRLCIDCYQSHALHAIMSLISFVVYYFHNFLTFLFKRQCCVIQSAHYMNTAFFSIPSQPYSPNSCTSRQHSELFGSVWLPQDTPRYPRTPQDNPEHLYICIFITFLQPPMTKFMIK